MNRITRKRIIRMMEVLEKRKNMLHVTEEMLNDVFLLVIMTKAIIYTHLSLKEPTPTVNFN